MIKPLKLPIKVIVINLYSSKLFLVVSAKRHAPLNLYQISQLVIISVHHAIIKSLIIKLFDLHVISFRCALRFPNNLQLLLSDNQLELSMFVNFFFFQARAIQRKILNFYRTTCHRKSHSFVVVYNICQQFGCCSN